MPMLLLSLLSMGSPWWEDYGITEKFLCPNERAVTLERNDAQASLIAGRFRSTLFREDSNLPGLRYRIRSAYCRKRTAWRRTVHPVRIRAEKQSKTIVGSNVKSRQGFSLP